jgi:UDP-N-acetylglucosamine 1-carboxyvinyltransferase
MSVTYVVHGPQTLGGTIRPTGNKNAALPVLAAALLVPDVVQVANVPRIRDVDALLTLMSETGTMVRWIGPHTVEVDSRSLTQAALSPALCARIRASVLLAAPLAVRCRRVVLAPPGGDVIGRRRLDTHFLALRQFGIACALTDALEFMAPHGVHAADLFLDEPSVTGTENAIMAAAAACGRTQIDNAACEPHVQDLCQFLMKAGVAIEGVGTNRLCITSPGWEALRGATYRLGPDHIEVASFIAMAAVTRSTLRIAEAGTRHLASTILGFEKLGVTLRVDQDDLVVDGGPQAVVQNDLGGQVPAIGDQPWPMFPPDSMSAAIVTATQAQGQVLFHSRMFESRLFFTDKLVAMGARIILCDPHRAIVSGPTPLIGRTVTSPDIRAGMAMLIAAMAARGQSQIQHAEQIERGYERLPERLGALGAQIEVVRSTVG